MTKVNPLQHQPWSFWDVSHQGWRKAEIGCQDGASGHVFGAIRPNRWGRTALWCWCRAHTPAPPALQHHRPCRKQHHLHCTLNFEDVASQQSPFSDHLSNKITCLNRKGQVSLANNCNEVWDFQFLQVRQFLAIEYKQRWSMLNQFYVRKSHASLNFQQKMTWVFGFCSAICFISFGGHTLPQGHDLQRFFKGLVLILILEVWWPKCSQCVNINLIMMLK